MDRVLCQGVCVGGGGGKNEGGREGRPVLGGGKVKRGCSGRGDKPVLGGVGVAGGGGGGKRVREGTNPYWGEWGV